MSSEPKPFNAYLKDWHKRPGRGRRWAAEQLNVSMSTYNHWCDGTFEPNVSLVLRLMALIDHYYSEPWAPLAKYLPSAPRSVKEA